MSVPLGDAAASQPAPPSTRPAWWRQALGGAAGSLAVLAVPLSLGLVAFAPLGAAAGPVGLWATAVTSVLGGLVYALASRAQVPAAGPSSATALILAGLLLNLLDSAVPVAQALALCAAAVSLSGGWQWLLARLGFARLVRLVPRPVLAGFMNGVALLILVGQLPLLLGLLPGTPLGPQGLAQAQAGALLVGLGTAALTLATARWRPRWPAALLGLVLGALAAAVLQLLWPGLAVGPGMGVSALVLPQVWPLAPLAQGGGLLQAHGGTVLVSAAVLALIGALESLLTLLALDEQFGGRHDPRRELQALGLCNLLCGALGSLPVVTLRARALAVRQAGGDGAGALLLGSLALAVVLTAGAPLLAWLPLPVLGGIMLVIGIGLLDHWSGRLLRHGWRGESSVELRASLAVMLAVCITTLWQGFAAGVALGVLLSMLLFIRRMNRSLLRQRLTGEQQPSRRAYPAPLEARLAALRPAIHTWELEGALFFGNAHRLRAHAEAALPRLRVLVLDLHRVTSVDDTGTAALAGLARLLQQHRVALLLAGVQPGDGTARALQAFGLALPLYPDADRAIEAAEQLLLGEVKDTTLAARPLPACDLLLGLDDTQLATVRALLTERRLFENEVLFRQGDAADGLYLLTLGSISIIGRDDAGVQTRRFVSLSAGMMIGETAWLDGGGRSADAVADTFAVVHHLGSAALSTLQARHPAVAAQLHRNIALHLSRRLRAASTAWAADRQ